MVASWKAALIGLMVLAGCGAQGVPGAQGPAPALDLPPMKLFGAAVPAAVTRSRTALAADFLDLSFLMESGRPLEQFSRFEGPIRVGVAGRNVPPTLERDLEQLLERMRREAGLDIARAGSGAPVNIMVETLPRAQLQRYVPQAACFVVPNVDSWDGFLRNRRGNVLDWSRVVVRSMAAVFIPDDVAPQEVRDCLHEEIAQAVGPLNDLYRLSDSIFNDDNFHTVLTGFDMLMLRVAYDRALRPGLSRAQAAQIVPGILARLAAGQPAGSARDIQRPAPRAWVEAVERALGPGTGGRARVQAAQTAVAIGAREDLGPARTGFGYYALGRLALGSRSDLALASFLAAGQQFAQVPGADIQQAHIGVQLAAFALAAGQGDVALEILNRHLDATMRAQNASLLATLLMMKAEALRLTGRASEAQAVRLDSLGWARYGFSSDAEIAARMRDIAAVTPQRRGS